MIIRYFGFDLFGSSTDSVPHNAVSTAENNRVQWYKSERCWNCDASANSVSGRFKLREPFFSKK